MTWELADALALSLTAAIEDEGRRREAARGLARSVRHHDDPEASVRWSPNGTVRAGRMMLERSNADTARRLAQALELPWHEQGERLVSLCADLGMPLIVGWDVEPGRRLYKLYANASDASVEHRERLLAVLGLRAPAPPEVLGLNVHATRVEAKAYLQRRERSELEAFAEELSARLPSALRAPPDSPAWVLSLDLHASAEATPRALFLAGAHGDEAGIERALQELTGLTWRELRERLPFPAGPLRQLGWGLSGDVTAYAKPAGTAKPVVALEPQAIFSAGQHEVGLYVEPSEHAPRAFSRTERHALTFRTRAGSPGRLIEVLGAWAESCVRAAEMQGREPDFTDPPAPWKRIVQPR